MAGRVPQHMQLYRIIEHDDYRKLEVLMDRGVIAPSHENMTAAITRFASAKVISVLLKHGAPLDGGRGHTNSSLASTLDPLAHYSVAYFYCDDGKKKQKRMEVIEVLLAYGASNVEALDMLETLNVPEEDLIYRLLRNPPTPFSSSPLSPASSISSTGSSGSL